MGIASEALMHEAAQELAQRAIRCLRLRHGSVDMLGIRVQEQYLRAVEIATGSLSARLTGMAPEYWTALRSVLTSREVAEQVSNLLDPGLEVFDTIQLATALGGVLPLDLPADERLKIAAEAWQEFLKAFSFASRSLPELREFLRASYEAGTYRRISDIASAAGELEERISGLATQEKSLRESMAEYGRDLAAYRQWAQAQA